MYMDVWMYGCMNVWIYVCIYINRHMDEVFAPVYSTLFVTGS